MSEALERVIAEQIKTIDQQQATIARQIEQLKLKGDIIEDAFKQIDTVCHWNMAADEDTRKKYQERQSALRLMLREHGRCHHCGTWEYNCTCHEDF